MQCINDVMYTRAQNKSQDKKEYLFERCNRPRLQIREHKFFFEIQEGTN